jgi:hypothetical protein
MRGLDDLRHSADPLDQALVDIGETLNAAQRSHTPGCGWCYPRLAGVLLAVRGAGHVDVVRYSATFNAYGRYRKTTTYVALEALSEASRAGRVKAGTVVHYGLDDNDVYLHEAFEGRRSSIASAVRTLNQRYADLFWMHYNPTVLDPAKGTIGERMIPIPHYEALYDIASIASQLPFATTLAALPNAIRRGHFGASTVPSERRDGPPRDAVAAASSPWSGRVALVQWRGATTGMYEDYGESDRFRVVSAFGPIRSTVVGARGAQEPQRRGLVRADVKFSAVVQGVTNVPAKMRGAELAPTQLMQARVLLDIDGNGNAWEGLRWKLLAGAAVVKVDAHRFVQWYYPLLRHGTHLWVVPPPTAEDVRRGSGRVAAVVNESLRIAAGETPEAAFGPRTGGTGDGEPLGAALARNAEQFGREHLTAPAVLAALRRIVSDLEPYRDTTRDWTVAGSRR